MNRPVSRSSGQPPSDDSSDLADELSSDDDDSSDATPPISAPKKKLSKSAIKDAGKVKEPKHKSASKNRQQSLVNASGLGGYLAKKVQLDEARHNEIQLCQQFERDELKIRQQFDCAKLLIADPNVDEVLKAAAREVLLKSITS